ncbi:uncharacterized protein LOC114749961 isoform X2 [Neltuma alba]|uniref:uncharacterized protein LOC114749961 isoform X2 n=1 Tax=Neltuma alba TaxID=207710 RepID=UPI0010A4B02A|nr:uncharacterized protein LOC114749961 isoform X2 [Prosopis alba]
MSQPNQEAYPPSTPVMAYPPPGQAYQHHQTPPPGYPTTVQGVQVSSHITPETNSKGEGFWKGWWVLSSLSLLLRYAAAGSWNFAVDADY